MEGLQDLGVYVGGPHIQRKYHIGPPKQGWSDVFLGPTLIIYIYIHIYIYTYFCPFQLVFIELRILHQV